MVDTVRTLAAMQALLADNTSGDISEQVARDLLMTVGAVVVKTADQTRTNTVVVVDDDDLAFPVEANGVYFFEVQTRENASHGFLMSWSVPAGTTMEWSSEFSANSGHDVVGASVELDVGAGGSVLGQSSGAQQGPHGFVFAGGTPGTVQLRWRPFTDPATATLKAYSHLRYRRLA